MEFGARELLIALAAIVVIAILFDCLRRVRHARHSSIRDSRRKQPIFNDDELDDYGSELPTGPARVVSVRDSHEMELRNKELRKVVEASKPKLNSFEKYKAAIAENTDAQLEADATEAIAAVATTDDSNDRAQSVPKSPVNTPDSDEKIPEVVVAPQSEQPELLADADAKPRPAPEKPAVKKDPAAIIVFHVMAKKGLPFAGKALLDALMKESMRYGSMKIFHRHEHRNGSGDVLFSMANGVEPGVFDLHKMPTYSTSGVSFFIDLESVKKPVEAFSLMLEAIATILEELGGILQDETRSTVTRQTIEHYRQQVRDYERRCSSM